MLKPIDKLINYISEKIVDKKLNRNDIEIDGIKEQLNGLKQLNGLLDEKEKEIQEHYSIIEEENEILSSLVKGECLYDVMKKIVHVIEKFAESSVGSVLIKKDGVLWDYCSPNLPKDYLDELSSGFPIGPNNGTCGAAAYYKEPFFVEDITTHKNWLNYPSVLEKARNFNCVSCYSSPILDNDNEVLGTVAIYCTDDIVCKKLHKRLLDWSTRVASIAIQKDRTLKELFNKNQQLDSVLESSTDLILRSDVDKKITYANKSFMEAFGLTEQDIEKGFDFSTLIHPDDIESFNKKYKVLFMPPYRGSHIHRSKTKTGEYRWYHWQGSAIFNKYNEIIEIQGNGRDITEEKRAKEKLRNYQKQLKSITNSINDAIVMFDEEGKISFWNPAATQIFGVTENEAENIHNIIVANKIKPKYSINYQKFIEGNFKNIVNETIEFKFSKLDGSIIDLCLNISEIILNDTWNAVVVIRDVTARKKSEQKIMKYFKEVEKKNKLLETVIDCSGGYLWFKDVHGKYVFCDRTFKTEFFKLPPVLSAQGYNDVEIINMYRETGKRHDFGDLCISTDAHSREKGNVCKYIEGGIVDDKLFILEVIKNPLFENGEYVGNIGFAFNRSNEIEQVKREIDYFDMINKIELLTEFDYNKSPFVYYIKNGDHKNECFADSK